MNDVITLVDESDQLDLSSRLRELSLRYHCHGFQCQCYPVRRWHDDRSLQLCCMAPCGVQVVDLQVSVCVCDEVKIEGEGVSDVSVPVCGAVSE